MYMSKRMIRVNQTSNSSEVVCSFFSKISVISLIMSFTSSTGGFSALSRSGFVTSSRSSRTLWNLTVSTNVAVFRVSTYVNTLNNVSKSYLEIGVSVAYFFQT